MGTAIVAMTGGSIHISREISMNRRYVIIATVQSMEVSRLCNSHSGLQCLESGTSACESVSCWLDTIGCNVACFKHLKMADRFARAACCRGHGLWLCQPSHKDCFCNVLKCSHRWPWCPGNNRGWICRGSTWLLAASFDSNVCVCSTNWLLSQLECFLWSA